MGKYKEKTRFRAYIFWFLLGGFGAHRFYLRRKTSGFILLGYTIITTAIDLIMTDKVSFFADDTFYWLTTVPLWLFLLWDAFQIPKWIDKINYEENGPAVFD